MTPPTVPDSMSELDPAAGITAAAGELVSAAVAGQLAGVSSAAIRKAATKGQVPGARLDRLGNWQIPADVARAWQQRTPTRRRVVRDGAELGPVAGADLVVDLSSTRRAENRVSGTADRPGALAGDVDGDWLRAELVNLRKQLETLRAVAETAGEMMGANHVLRAENAGLRAQLVMLRASTGDREGG